MSSLHDAIAQDLGQESRTISLVRRINDSWIVRGRLRENTSAYLDHLEATDPRRLFLTCECTMGMVKYHRMKSEDPKALFYSGIFSLATPGEIETFLSEHYLTGAVASILRGNYDRLKVLPLPVRRLAEVLARRIREYLADFQKS